MKSDIFTVIDDIDIFITNHNGKKIELSRLILNLELYENIFSFFLTGKLVVADTLDLIKNFIIIGNEDIDISIHTTDSDQSINLSFKVYKINRDISNMKGDTKRKIFELYFCSSEAIIDRTQSISKKLSGNPENIVQTLLTINLLSTKTLTTESTSSSVDIYSNFWNPSKIINFLLKLSKNASYSDYIFFEDFDGFNFKSLSGILNESEVHKISFKNDTESFIGNNKIKIYKFNSYFDIIELLKASIFGSTFYKPNDTEYSYLKNEKTLSNVYDDIVTNGSSKHFHDNLSSSLNMVNTNFYEPDISEIRLPSLKLLQNYNLAVQINGDFIRKCGDNLDINFPNLDNISTINESFNGKWLILGIRHIISQNNIYLQNMLLCKNAFFNQPTLESITSKISV